MSEHNFKWFALMSNEEKEENGCDEYNFEPTVLMSNDNMTIKDLHKKSAKLYKDLCKYDYRLMRLKEEEKKIEKEKKRIKKELNDVTLILEYFYGNNYDGFDEKGRPKRKGGGIK